MTYPKYTELENFLQTGLTPEEIGNVLDQTLCDLVHYAGKEEGYARQLADRYYLIKRLRDIFWAMDKTESSWKPDAH